MPDENPYQQLSTFLGAAGSEILPQIIARIADEREIPILLAAFPAATAAELAAKTGISEEEVRARIRPLFLKGLLFFSKKEGEPRYYRVKTVPQFHDSSILWKEADREFHALWKEYMAREWPEFGKTVEALIPRPVVRVVPVGATVEAKARVLAFEDVREIVRQARTLAVTPCTCRVIDGRCGKPVETCIQVNRAADYALERGTGRALTQEEAISLLCFAEKEGLVHIVDNRQKVDHIICNCCRDCCMNWRLPHPQKFVAPSRFRARVLPDECIGCHTCLERCFFEAIHMNGDEPRARIDAEKCVGCGVCTVTCPTEAIVMKPVSPPEMVPV